MIVLLMVALLLSNSNTIGLKRNQHLPRLRASNFSLNEFVNRNIFGTPSDGQLPDIVIILDELIKSTAKAKTELESNTQKAKILKIEKYNEFSKAKNETNEANENFESSDVKKSFDAAKLAENAAKNLFTEAKTHFSEAVEAHEFQNVESEIQSLQAVKNLVYKLLTGTHMPTISPTDSPTHMPTTSPTESPTPEPTSSPTTPSPTDSPTPAPTPSPTESPTSTPTSSPTPPTTLSPTMSALADLQVPKHQRMVTSTRTIVWIDKNDDIICMGECGLSDDRLRSTDPEEWGSRRKKDWFLGAIEQDNFAFSIFKNDSLIEPPLWYGKTKEWMQDKRPDVTSKYAMWGRVDIESATKLIGKKPISVGTTTQLHVLFDDGSIWNQMAFTSAYLQSLWDTVYWPHPPQPKAHELMVNNSGSGNFDNGPDHWHKASGNTIFTRISTGHNPGFTRAPYLFAWDANNDFYIYFDTIGFLRGNRITDSIFTSFFRWCSFVADKGDEYNERKYWWWRKPYEGYQVKSGEFFKWPRECYPMQGNVVDVFIYQAYQGFLLFDGNGGTGNLWSFGAIEYQGSFGPWEQWEPYKASNSWFLQWGRNFRVTTMTHSGDTLYVSTRDDGVWGIGRDRDNLIYPLPRKPDSMNWTKMVNQSVLTAPIRKMMYAHQKGIFFLLENGDVWYREKPWFDARYDNPDSTRWIQRPEWIDAGFLGKVIDMHNTYNNAIFIDHDGSHSHFGESPLNCIWERFQGLSGSSENLNGAQFLWPVGPKFSHGVEKCEGSGDMGQINDLLRIR